MSAPASSAAPKPSYKITANGANITGKIQERLINLSITDEAGIKADAFQLTLADPHSQLDIPKTRAEIEISIGYDKKILPMGKYRLSDVGWIKGQLTLSGHAADCAVSLITQKKRTFDYRKGAPAEGPPGANDFADTQHKNFGEIVRLIASEHKLTAKIHHSLDKKDVGHVDQSYESDINLLTRLGDEIGAVVKVVDNILIATPKGIAEDTAGKKLNTIIINPKQIIEYTYRTSERERFTRVGAVWVDKEGGESTPVFAGSGEPTAYVRGNFPSKERALSAATAELKKMSAGKETLEIKLVGNPQIIAEMPIKFAPRRDINADWIIVSARHDISRNGYTTSASCTRPEQPLAFPAEKDFNEYGGATRATASAGIITLKDYYNNHDTTYKSLLNSYIATNAQRTVDNANRLLQMMADDGVSIANVRCNSGWRPKPYNSQIKGSDPNSPHTTAQAIDLSDRTAALDNWVQANPAKVLACGFLATELPSLTKNWCHLQTRELLEGQVGKAILTVARGQWVDYKNRA